MLLSCAATWWQCKVIKSLNQCLHESTNLKYYLQYLPNDEQTLVYKSPRSLLSSGSPLMLTFDGDRSVFPPRGQTGGVSTRGTVPELELLLGLSAAQVMSVMERRRGASDRCLMNLGANTHLSDRFAFRARSPEWSSIT